MKGRTRYAISGLEEAQLEPGSRGRVLKNLLGITSKRAMDAMEGSELLRALNDASRLFDETHRFSASDICQLHKLWLGGIYRWAGSYRQVNIAKDGFTFAPASQIPRLMAEFEEGPLKTFTPCRPGSSANISRALATVHAELVLVHPFREGNGRTARLLATLMCLQAELPVISFEGLSRRNKAAYFTAIRSGLGGDYAPLTTLFSAVIVQASQGRGGGPEQASP